MLRKLILSLVAAGSAFSASSAFAFFDVEVMTGKRWYSLDSTPKVGIASQEIDVAAHVDPIPLIPVAFGAKFQLGTLNPGDFSNLKSVDSATVFAAGIDVMAWIPMVPIITPYARLDIPVTGTLAVKGKTTDPTDATKTTDYAETGSISGVDLGIGIKYSPIPLVRILLELENGSEKYKQTEIKEGGVTHNELNKTYNMASNCVLLGVEIGL